ncbi:MAG: endonuclease/exonuclease/phosphatase family protein [Bdellovibrionales bacterium]
MKNIFFSLILTLSPYALSSEISVMTFNVENLFDTKKDPGKEDHTFLPIEVKSTNEIKSFCQKLKGHYKKECYNLDWDQQVLAQKMKNLSRVILSYNNGRGPDVLMLTEVENNSVLTQLNNNFLKAAGYQTQVIVEGPDPRGIDVALLSRLKMDNKPELHLLTKNSRGLLEVHLRTPEGSILKVFVGHFPSQRNPRSSRQQHVEKSVEILSQLENQMYILGGDLNISAHEEKETGFFRKHFSKVGLVGHLVACQNCSGTHKYRGQWSFLDTLIFSKNLGEDENSPYILDKSSLQVHSKDTNHIRKGQPQRFNPDSGTGVSDHLPMVGILKLRDKKPKTSHPNRH